MKSLFIVLIFLSVKLYAYGQPVTFHGKINDEKFNNKIDSVITFKYPTVIKEEKIEKDRFFDSKYKIIFNDNNLITEKIFYNLKGEETDTYKYEYDKNNNITLEEAINFRGETRFIIGLKYDEHGRIIEKRHGGLYGGNKNWIIRNNYVDNTAKRYLIKEDGSINEFPEVSIYYDDGNQILKVESDSYVWQYRYDNAGNLLTLIFDRRMRMIFLDDDKKQVPLVSEESTYDSNFNVLSYIKKGEGQIDKEVRFEYKYDKYNNWLRKIEFWEEEPVYIYERILYYK